MAAAVGVAAAGPPGPGRAARPPLRPPVPRPRPPRPQVRSPAQGGGRFRGPRGPVTADPGLLAAAGPVRDRRERPPEPPCPGPLPGLPGTARGLRGAAGAGPALAGPKPGAAPAATGQRRPRAAEPRPGAGPVGQGGLTEPLNKEGPRAPAGTAPAPRGAGGSGALSGAGLFQCPRCSRPREVIGVVWGAAPVAPCLSPLPCGQQMRGGRARCPRALCLPSVCCFPLASRGGGFPTSRLV